MKKYNVALGFILIALMFLTSCDLATKKSSKIAQEKDYISYMNLEADAASPKFKQLEEQLSFWSKKLAKEPNSGLYKLKMAYVLAERFKAKGDIEDIHRSDDLLKDALTKSLLKKSAYYHALSKNAITQHQFKEALAYADLGLKTKEAIDVSQFMRFDALMELGDLEAAEAALSVKNEDENTFDYLIRKSKLQDAKGDLVGATITLESTKKWVEDFQNPTLYCWVMSNLGDMYGHGGNVEKSYAYYLKTLQMNPSHYYALKGIAWITFSNDKDTKQTKKILDYLKKVQPSPDLELFSAEIASFEGDEVVARQHLTAFTKAVQQEKYGQMYDSYLADVFLQDKKRIEEAKYYVEREIEHRPTPHSFLLLARYHAERGDTAKAMEIVKRHVEGKTEEPNALYHIGMIAQMSGNKNMAKDYLRTASEASFELGPIIANDIQLAIN